MRYDNMRRDIDYEMLLGTEWNCENGPGITFREFADDQCISYEAVRRQVANYKKELYPHMRKEYRTYYLDDYAVQFLEERRRPQAQPDDSKQIRAQIKQLRDNLQESSLAKENYDKLYQELGSLKTENEYLKKEYEQCQKKLEEKETSYTELEKEYDDLRIRRLIEGNNYIIEINRKQNIIDKLLSMLLETHVLNEQNIEELLSIFHSSPTKVTDDNSFEL